MKMKKIWIKKIIMKKIVINSNEIVILVNKLILLKMI